MEPEEFDATELAFEELEPRRLTAMDIVVALWAFWATLIENLDMFNNHVCKLLVAHRNYKTEQTEFADRVRYELESIPETEEQ